MKSTSSEILQTYDILASSVPFHLVLKLPDSLTGVTKYYEYFVRCEEADVANAVKLKVDVTTVVKPGYTWSEGKSEDQR